jgi:hypothetical protein
VNKEAAFLDALALAVSTLGMFEENRRNERNGGVLPYDSNDFFVVEQSILAIAAKLRENRGTGN